MVQRVLGFAVLCLSLFLIWQGYENSRLTPETLRMSQAAVCEQYGGCTRGVPTKSKSDMIRRQYEWLTQNGPYVATCKRDKLFMGDWSCEIAPGKLGVGGGY